MKKILLSVMALLFLSLSCAKKVEQGYTGEQGGTLIVGLLDEPSSLLPLYPSMEGQSPIVIKLFEPLHKIGKDGKVKPGIATSWFYSEDLKSITYSIRPDAKWWDGKPITADDIVYTYNLMKNPKTGYLGAYSLRYIDNVEKINEHSVKFTFKGIYADELLNSNIYPLPFHKIKNEKDIKTSLFNFEPVGDGPFKLDKWVRGIRIELVANPDYYLGRPPIDRIIYWFAPSIDALIDEVKLGHIHIAPNLPPGKYEGLKGYKKVITPGNSYTYIGWNLRNPLFKDKKVRKALTEAINRKKIIKTVLSGYGEVSTGPIVPSNWAYDENLKPLPYNPAEAKKILATFGWKDRNRDGYLDKKRKTFKFTLLVDENDPTRKPVADMIAKDLKKIGIKVKVIPLSATNFIARLFHKSFDAYILGWTISNELDPTPIWNSKGIYNFVGYHNSEVDELIEKGILSLDRKRGKTIWKEFQEKIVSDMPYTFLYVPHSITLLKSGVKGYNKDDKRKLSDYIDYCWIPKNQRVPIDYTKLGEHYQSLLVAQAKKSIKRKKRIKLTVAKKKKVSTEKILETALMKKTTETTPTQKAVSAVSTKKEATPPPIEEEVTALKQEPRVKKLVVPNYPEAAKIVGAKGRVYVQVTVGIKGKVIKAIILKSFGNPACDAEALKAAKKCIFEPGTINGEPAVMTAVIPFDFPPY